MFNMQKYENLKQKFMKEKILKHITKDEEKNVMGNVIDKCNFNGKDVITLKYKDILTYIVDGEVYRTDSIITQVFNKYEIMVALTI